MKKIILFCCSMLLIFSLMACNKSGSKKSELSNSNVFSENDKIVSNKKSAKNTKKNSVNMDWSKMNYNMLSAAIFDVQINPEKYINKRIKATGNFHTSLHEGKRTFSIVVWDSTGCCPAGFDFVPPETMKYPEDFPSMDSRITVTCVFNYYEEDGKDFFIFNAEEILSE